MNLKYLNASRTNARKEKLLKVYEVSFKERKQKACDGITGFRGKNLGT